MAVKIIKKNLAALILIILLMLSIPTKAGAQEIKKNNKVIQDSYASSEKCAECHQEKYIGWKKTLHSTMIQDVKKKPDAVLGDFTVPDLEFKIEDVYYTVGSHWDQRYMTMIGEELYVLPKLWSVQSKKWQPYNIFAWKKKPWSKYCAGCHVTAYNPDNRSYVEMTVGCECCHGPGAKHSESKKDADIVNPAKLSKERSDMICASCHVRGLDNTGEYYFPIGFLPGSNLADHYTPVDKMENETNTQAIKRIYEEWKSDHEGAARTRCEVCGIRGSKERMQISNDVLKFCYGCHDFQDNLPVHTYHPEETNMICTDCHVQKPLELNGANLAGDIHSYGYYLVHKDACYNQNIEQACIQCHNHQDKTPEWAIEAILKRGKKLPPLDH